MAIIGNKYDALLNGASGDADAAKSYRVNSDVFLEFENFDKMCLIQMILTVMALIPNPTNAK